MFSKEYSDLRIGMDILMSDNTKKQLSELKEGFDYSDSELIDVAFVAGWVKGVEDCDFKTFRDYAIWKDKIEQDQSKEQVENEEQEK